MVSLIVPCYNGEKFVNRCLDSILEQTYENIELIFVNDGSTDRTDEIIGSRRAELLHKLAAFVYISQDNQGVGAACNRGFKSVRGEYLALMDVDDFMMPTSIQKRADWLDSHPDYGLVRMNGYYVQEGAESRNDRLFEVNEDMKKKEDIFDDLMEGRCHVWSGSYMIRMELLDSIYPDREIYPSRNGQNMQFLLAAAHKSKAGFIDLPLMKYVRYRDSLSRFSSDDALVREISAMNGYRDIREQMIARLLPAGEQVLWRERLDLLYAKQFMDIALKYGDRKLMADNYNRVKGLTGGKPDLGTRILYYRLMNPAIYAGLRVMRKLRLLH